MGKVTPTIHLGETGKLKWISQLTDMCTWNVMKMDSMNTLGKNYQDKVLQTAARSACKQVCGRAKLVVE